MCNDGGLKGQLLGPISLVVQLTDEHQQPLLTDLVLFEGVVVDCCLRARMQAEALMRTNRPALVCIEEPFADVMRSPFMTIDRAELLVALARVFLAVPCARGLAIRCGNPLSDFGSLAFDLLMITHWDNALMRDFDFAELVRVSAMASTAVWESYPYRERQRMMYQAPTSGSMR